MRLVDPPPLCLKHFTDRAVDIRCRTAEYPVRAKQLADLIKGHFWVHQMLDHVRHDDRVKEPFLKTGVF